MSRRTSRTRRGIGTLSSILILAGALLFLDAGVTLVWQEPLSALYGKVNQDRLDGRLDRLEREPAPLAQLRALAGLQSSQQRVAFLARALRRRVRPGDPIGRIGIARIGLSTVVVEGTNPDDLREGPGHYDETPLPGLRGTVAIAGHRTTYLAPFRQLDRLRARDKIVVEMPYGRFTYEVERTRIVSPTAFYVIRRASYDRLVLTACHPLYSAAQRIVVFARLVATEPRGQALR